MTPKANDPSKGGNQRIYMDLEATLLLNQAVVALGMAKSNVVCGLIRAASGHPPKPGEDRVVNLLKKALGREHFLAFLDAVKACLNNDWKEIVPDKPKGEFKADSWVHPLKIGLLAFYAANEDNQGKMISSALAMKAAHSLTEIYVCTTHDQSLPKETRSDLNKIGIHIVALATLSECLNDRIQDHSLDVINRQKQ